MGLTEQLFGSGAERFANCIEFKIAKLNEKHKDFLSDQNINLNEGSYMITFDPGGRIGFRRTRNISNEIDSEIDRILNQCVEEHLLKL